MPRLTANKTTLYKLVSEHMPLPPMRKTEFSKVDKVDSWFLRWNTNDGSYYAHFSTLAGRPVLNFKMPGGWGDFIILSVGELRDRGMIK